METKLLFDLLCKRRSVRLWQKKPVPDIFIEKIIEAGRLAPTSGNSQPQEFIILTNESLIKRLLSERLQQKRAPFYIVSKQWKDEQLEYRSVDIPPVLIVLCYNLNKFNHYPDIYFSIGCVGMSMWLMAASLKLGMVWLFADDQEEPLEKRRIKKILDLPEWIHPAALMPVGYPAYTPHMVRKPDQL